MPTLDEWLDLDLDEQDRELLRRLHELRPKWLETGCVEEEVIVRLVSEIEGAWPIVLGLEDLTLSWGEWHAHFDLFDYVWPPIEPAIAIIGLVEGILSGWWVRAVAYDASGAWAGSHLRPCEELKPYLDEHWKKGNRLVVTRWPGIVVVS